jgi:hypothetical protein
MNMAARWERVDNMILICLGWGYCVWHRHPLPCVFIDYEEENHSSCDVLSVQKPNNHPDDIWHANKLSSDHVYSSVYYNQVPANL